MPGLGGRSHKKIQTLPGHRIDGSGHTTLQAPRGKGPEIRNFIPISLMLILTLSPLTASKGEACTGD